MLDKKRAMDRAESNHFRQRINNLRVATLVAGKRVGVNLARAVFALQNRQTSIARDVIGAEWSMEGLARGIHSSYLHAMGYRQLTVKDIRLLFLGLEVARKLIEMSRIVIRVAQSALEIS